MSDRPIIAICALTALLAPMWPRDARA